MMARPSTRFARGSRGCASSFRESRRRTGGPALSNDEMRTAFKDSQLATGLAFALTLGLLVWRSEDSGSLSSCWRSSG